MANVIICCGDVSSGKTHSLRNLNPEKTAIINVLGKALPWRGSKKQYTDEKKNIKTLIDSHSISTALEALGKTDKEVIIVDDVGYAMLQEFFEKATIGGYMSCSL